MPKQRAKSYRLRMVFNHWYLHLLDEKRVYYAELGPFDFKTANQEADKLVKQGIVDEDKKDVPAHQRS